MRRFFTRALVFVAAATSAGAALAQAPAPSVPPTIGVPPIVDVPPIIIVPPPSDGLLKVCKVGGPGIAPGTPFTITAGSSTFTVPSGPAPGGTCVVGPKFPVGTHVTVAETIPAGILVSSIAVAPSARLDGAPNLAVGSANITIGSGVTEVTFTNKHTGFLEICKTGEVQGDFSFSVNPGNLGPYVVPAGACSPAIEVAAGVVTIHELPSAGSAMAGCTSIPPVQQGTCNLGAQISTVTVAPGDISTMTIAFIANKKVTDAVDVSLDKKFVSGPTKGTGAFTLTVKNEGAPIAPGTTIRINDPVPAGVTLTGFGGNSGASWNCTPPSFPVVGANTLTCTFTGSGTIATGALLPALVLNATLALAGSEIGIYSNCAMVVLSNATGPVTESNTANNRACAVTASINPQPCESGKCPQPVAVCKQDVLMVIDASLSVTPNGLNTVKNAIARFLQPMQGKGRVNIFSFNNQPNWTPITTGGWNSVTSANWTTLANPIMLGGTKTNWDDALERAKNVMAPNPPLVLFVTDGDPNASNDVNGAEVDNTNTPVTAATEAVQWINAIRGAGSPIIAIGFGQVANAGYIDAAFTGNVSGPGSINFETSSVIKMPSVNDLPAVMATLGNQMCRTLSLSKRTGGFSHPVPAGTTSFPVNDNIPFTLELTNNATTQVTGVEVQDQVPAALSAVTVTAASSGTSFSPPPASNLIKWLIPTLPPRTTVALSFTGTVNKPFAVPSSETYTNYAQVTAAQNYSATALNNMNPVSGPVIEVDEAVAAASVSVYVPSPPVCDATPKPAFCYLQVSKVQNNPESCTPSVGGNCQYTVGVTLNSTYIPAGSTVTVADTFMVGTTPVSTPWSATVPAGFCSGGAQTAVPFTCNHGSLTSFSGVMSATIPPGQNAQLKNCITVTVANMANTTPPTVSATACAP